MMIPFINQDDLILDNNRQIIPSAKIEVYDPVSNTPIDVFTYDGANENYIISTNPIYLNGHSRPEHTYFSNKLVLCRLYKYIGGFSDPRVDDDTDDWQFVREWNGAFTLDEIVNDTIIFGIEALKESNPALGSVTVVGYWNAKDCEARNYIWDSNCTQTPDNGYIIKSDGIDTGRWILKFDHEYLPSTYYGVYPSKESNINALLSYVDSVGSNSTRTAPGIYFVPGTYDASTVALATSKKLLIDSSTTFTRDSISADDIKVIGGRIPNPICDFYFNYTHNSHNISVAHSSWFKSVSAFITCGAKKLIIDESNHFTDRKLYGNFTLDNKEIIVSKRIDIDYNNHYLTINKCVINSDKWIDPSMDYIKFQNMNITDRWFISTNLNNFDFGKISNSNWLPDGNHIEASSSSLNTLSLSNFDSAAIWLKWQIANGIKDINLEGRYVALINYNEIENLTNAKFGDLVYNNNLGSLNITNSDGVISDMIIKDLNIDNSRITFNTSPRNDISATVTVNDSIITQGVTGVDNNWKNSNVSVRAINSTWNVGMDYTNNDNTTAQDAYVRFIKCTLNKNNNPLSLKRCEFVDCVLNNQTISIYPYKVNGIDNVDHYYLEGKFINNKIDSINDIKFTKYEDDNCYNVYFRLVMSGNNFINQGISCRYWQNRLGSNYDELFIANIFWVDEPEYANVERHIFEYKSNIGNCPKENFSNISFSRSNFLSNFLNNLQTNAVDVQDVFPPLNQSLANTPSNPALVNTPLYYNGIFDNISLPINFYAVSHDGGRGLKSISDENILYYQPDSELGIGDDNGSLFNMSIGFLNTLDSLDEIGDRIIIF